MLRSVRLLLIEDSEEDCEIFRMRLTRRARSLLFELECRGSFQDGIEAARSGTHDVIILDLNLPDGCGPELISQLREAGFGLPIFVHSGCDLPEKIREAMDLGAAGYLVKAEFDVASFEEAIGKLR